MYSVYCVNRSKIVWPKSRVIVFIRERKLTNKLTLKKNIRLLKLPCWIGRTEWSLLKHVKKVYTLHGYIMRGHASSSSRMSSYFWLVGAIFISLLAGYQDIKPFGIAKKWYFEEIWSARSAFCTIFFSVRERAVFYKSCNLIGFESGQYSPHPAYSQRAVSDPFKKNVSKFSWKLFKSPFNIITQINMFWWNLSLSFALPLFSLPSTRS